MVLGGRGGLNGRCADVVLGDVASHSLTERDFEAVVPYFLGYLSRL